MPNWCLNEVQLSGPRADMLLLLEAADHKNNKFCFNGIRPHPIELEGIHNGFTHINGIKHENWRDIDGVAIAISPTQEEALISKYGAINLIDWCIRNWGTKWEPSGLDYTYDDILSNDPTIEVHLYFETAWGPPEELYHFIRRTYPTIHIDWFYKEPLMRSSGWLEDTTS